MLGTNQGELLWGMTWRNVSFIVTELEAGTVWNLLAREVFLHFQSQQWTPELFLISRSGLRYSAEPGQTMCPLHFP